MRQWSGWVSTLKSVMMIEKKKRKRNGGDREDLWGNATEEEGRVGDLSVGEEAGKKEGGERGNEEDEDEHSSSSSSLPASHPPSLPSFLPPPLISTLTLSPEEMTAIGVRIKRIFDQGRVEYLKSRGNSKMCAFMLPFSLPST